jgi:hypothetical protein
MILSRPNPDVLYDLLPETYRVADADQGYPLRALMRLIGNQAELVRADVQQLWDNFFIETAQQWAIPYIGDLVSNRTLHDIDLAPDATTAESIFPDLAGPDLRPISTIRTRADVAKTIYYRRRKGTTAMLEQLAKDVTGWGAHVVEFFEILTWNQNLNHLRLQSPGCVNLQSVTNCAQVETAFDQSSHIVDVRAISQSEGWHNVPNLGFFLYRLESFPIEHVKARSIGGTSWRFTFSPLGNSAPLFASPRASVDPGMSEELLVPEAIPPTAFFDDLAQWNATPLTAQQDFSLYYGDAADDPNWSITVYEQAAAVSTLVPVDVGHVYCANLKNWTTIARPADDRVGIDVVRGRLIIGSLRAASHAIYASYNYGFSAHLGGGPYEDRQKWILPDAAADQIITVDATTSLDAALGQWAANTAKNTIIKIADNDTHALTPALALDPTKWIAIQAVPGFRPHIQPQGATSTLLISGGAPGASLTLNGLLIEGGIQVSQDIATLRILHSTLVPDRSIVEELAAPPTGPSIEVDATDGAGNTINTSLQVQIAYSILGALVIPESIDTFYLLDSIVDGQSAATAIGNAASTNGPRATIERSTILGATWFRKFDLCSDSIFTGVVTVEQTVSGCLRFSFVPPNSTVPQQYRCQPAMEIASEIAAAKSAAQAAGQTLPPGWDTALANAIEQWLVPSFEIDVYGQPEYCQLQLATPLQIRTGASDGAEMGALNQLKQPQRETNLRIRLEEYVPFGRSAGIIYVT